MVKMQFDVITLFPDMFDAISNEGVVARAIQCGVVKLNRWQLRDFSDNRYRNIDDKPYGGGAGMVMQVKPIRACLAAIKHKQPESKVIYLSPQGKPFRQDLINHLLKLQAITLLCGRYQGIDERVLKYDVDMEISLGDFILSGGEIAAMALIDAMSRQLQGVLGNTHSKNESFKYGLLEAPLYTRPKIIDGQAVPDVLLSGHDKNIKKYKQQQALKRTKQKRPDLLEQ